jgi:hypothetical protein
MHGKVRWTRGVQGMGRPGKRVDYSTRAESEKKVGPKAGSGGGGVRGLVTDASSLLPLSTRILRRGVGRGIVNHWSLLAMGWMDI